MTSTTYQDHLYLFFDEVLGHLCTDLKTASVPVPGWFQHRFFWSGCEAQLTWGVGFLTDPAVKVGISTLVDEDERPEFLEEHVRFHGTDDPYHVASRIYKCLVSLEERL